MSILLYLIPIALLLGFIGLGAFVWALKSGQYEDLDGAAQRILMDEDEEEDNSQKLISINYFCILIWHVFNQNNKTPLLRRER